MLTVDMAAKIDLRPWLAAAADLPATFKKSRLVIFFIFYTSCPDLNPAPSGAEGKLIICI